MGDIPVLDPIEIGTSASVPDVSQLTTKSIDGVGVFDILMQTVKMHLLEEFNGDRITGTQYSEVYLGALGAVLQQSVAFIMNHEQTKQITAEIGLIRQKTVTELANTDTTTILGLGFNATTDILGLVKAQLDGELKKNLLIDEQINNVKTEIDLVGQKIVTELAQTDTDLGSKIATAGYGFNDSSKIEGIVAATLTKMAVEEDLLTQKLVTEVGQTSNTKPIDLGKMNTTDITGLVQAQVNKTKKEETLLAQKTMTELAQTSEELVTTTDALNILPTVGGLSDRQRKLFTAQTDGFARDAEQKLTKMLLETWSVNATVGDASANIDNQLTDYSIGKVVQKAKDGIDVIGFTPDPVGPTVTSIAPTTGPASTVVVITGTNLSTVTSVLFGGIPAASFIIDSSTQITATAAASTTGRITVTSTGGTGTSIEDFVFV